MTIEDQFSMCMPGLISEDTEKLRTDLVDLDQMPYQIKLTKVNGYHEPCWYESTSCRGCHLAYTDDKVMDLLKAGSLDSNETLYSNNRMKAGKEVQLEVIWHHSITKLLFAQLSTA